MDPQLNTIQLGDCIEQMSKLPEGSIDLAFADPPFNIGYEYDVYDDSVEHQQYIDWSKEWISAVYRVLKSSGTFWLAIGDEYAAELKLASHAIGFHCRSWVVWYYTFGVNCARKFTRSHAHLFHFIKDPADFTFRDDDLDNRVPSARELVYNDKRANSKGRLPDDTWIIRPADVVGEIISDDDGTWSPNLLTAPSDKNRTFELRPQDMDGGFTPSEDTWYFPRVAGTFKERAGFHGCQMPEQLLGRIIRTCSNPGDAVLDPFSGSATTLAVAKKLGRTYLGFELSKDYVTYGLKRLDSICVGDRLDGSAEPLKSAPKTGEKEKGKAKKRKKDARANAAEERRRATESRYEAVQLELTLRGIVEAFRLSHDGFSADRVVADPDLNQEFLNACNRLGIVGDPRTWNTMLFRLRKAGKLADIETAHRTTIEWKDCDEYLFASEIALQSILDEGKAESFDEILCDPVLVTQFDQFARRLAPGYKPLDYRWAALRLRKEAKKARTRAAVLKAPKQFEPKVPIEDLDTEKLPEVPGLYLLSEGSKTKIYVGETMNLRRRLDLQFAPFQMAVWGQMSKSLVIQTLPMPDSNAGMLTWQSCMVRKYKQRPRLNYHELRSS